MKVVLAQPRGFCAGVVRAIEIVERALEKYGPPVYVRHEIVHNKYVVESLKARGAQFVEEVSEIPPNSVAIFSAHGVAKSVEEEAASRNLPVLDATCPLVTKVHNQGKRYVAQGRTLILIGHAGHPEVEGTLGQIPAPVVLIQTEDDVGRLDIPDDSPVAYVTQTTLSVDDTREIIAVLVARFPGIVGPALADICYATQNRQTAVRLMAPRIDRLLVVGARNSSNAARLREVGSQQDVPSWLVEAADQIDPTWLLGARCIGVTAGASTPESLVQGVVDRLRALGARTVRQLPGKPESVQFRLPQGLGPEVTDTESAVLQPLAALP
jgi:4-hydroxy-3-methylbut-2-en-1-yl diphosphate reductase